MRVYQLSVYIFELQGQVASASEERSKRSYTVNSGEFLPFGSPEDPFVIVLISVSQSVSGTAD